LIATAGVSAETRASTAAKAIAGRASDPGPPGGRFVNAIPRAATRR